MDEAMTKEEKIERYKELNKTAEKGKIVCAGSSLMEMFPIEQFIREDHVDITVYNRGIGGYVTEELLHNVDTCIVDLEPSKLFINIGTNDLSDASIPIAKIMDNYERILTIVKERVPGVKIYLMAYYPINYEAAAEEMKPCLLIRTNEKIRQANEAVKALAAKLHVRYIDINDPLKDENGALKAEYTIEGMHIKEEGYRTIYPRLLGYMLEE